MSIMLPLQAYLSIINDVMKATIYLHPSKQNTILRGHPWVFPKAIIRQQGSCKTGELVDVCNATGELLAVGAYNEHSLYRVRILAYEPVSSIRELIKTRLLQAKQLRETIQLPNALTNAYRLFNSEADGLSGLTIDRFNTTCVIASTAYWVEAHQQIIRECLQEILPQDILIWFSQAKPLAQDGWKEVTSQSHNQIEQVLEAGIRYQVNFSNTQKTGLFLDQRENHQRIAALATGKRVLDLYSYTGGFALHAARAGASHITAVDSSEQAIDLAKQNAMLNAIDSIEFVAADARDYLAKAGDYDIVVLDPPKLVPSVKHIERAKNYYRYLHRETFKHMRSGSLLMTCNCSSALNAQQFSELVSAQALAVGKMVRVIGIYGPSSCHPTLAAFPEGHYLTAVLLAVV